IAHDDHAFRVVATAVPASENRRAFAAIAEHPCQLGDHRRLSAPARREVADANDRVRKAAAALRSPRVPRAPHLGDAPVHAAEETGWRSPADRPGQWTTRKGRTTASRSTGGKRPWITARVRSPAPRFDSTSARAAAPRRARRTGSPARLTIVSSNS